MSGHSLESLAARRAPKEVADVCARWGLREEADGAEPRRLVARLTDAELVRQRLAELPERLQALLTQFLQAPAAMRTRAEIDALPVNGSAGSAEPAATATKAARAGRVELEVALQTLVREGFLWPEVEGFAVPQELAECLAKLRGHDQGKLHETLSLQGWLESRWFHCAAEAERAHKAEHARKVCKLYLLPESIAARVKALPGPVRAVFDRALVDFGGVLPVAELAGERALDAGALKQALEEAQLGSVALLPLERVGLQPVEAVVLFQEVVLHALGEHARQHPPKVEETLACGIDLVTNLARFLRELGSGEVQFTAEGRLYRASEKRIAKGLLPLPGGFLDADQMTAWLYKLCVQRRLVDRRGARALGLTQGGAELEGLPLHDKLRQMLAFAVEERDLPGEPFHQVRLRRLLLRLLGREPAEQWLEAPLLPFLARASYLPTLDADSVRAYFATRASYAGYAPSESVAQLCWNLLAFVKRRLFALGLVELGLCGKRPVAVRLSRLGAELLGDGKAKGVAGERATWIVNPDFEVLVFPGDDLHDALHALDRFARRTKSDHVHHYQLSRDSVRAGLGLGCGLDMAQIAQVLADRARVPIPQNVLWTLADWVK